MSSCWQILLLDALEMLDGEEEPHGLYGMRQAHTRSAKGKLPKLANLLSCPGERNILRRSGFRNVRSWFGSDLRFTTESGECVVLKVLDHATTKVRHYGSAYRLDEHYRKQASEVEWDLESVLPKISTRDRIDGILLFFHYHRRKELQHLFGQSADPDFLSRYRLAIFSREWEDRYGRGFKTAIHLWAPQETNVQPGPAS